MESASKLNPNPLLINTSNHLHSIFSQLPNFFLLIFLTSIEIIFILQRSKPIFHFLFLFSLLFFSLLKHYFFKPTSPVYLVDFSCFKPPSFCRVPFSTFLENASMFESFNKESVTFMAKILNSSGQSEETCLPPALHYIPPKIHYQESIKEAHMVLFSVMDDLLIKTDLCPRDIDILIVNCSGFCPSPSLSSIIINKYCMRSDIKSYNLSGMGCSASALGIDLAKNLLQIHENSYALVLSTEILSTGWYKGNEQPKLIINCLFRMGSSAVLLTNKKEARSFSKYNLFTSLRTQTAMDDKSYLSAIVEDDTDGKQGVTLRKDLLQVVGEALRSHITVLASSILPFSEKYKHVVSLIRKHYFFMNKSEESSIYMPNFKSVIQHFCFPTSGKLVLREIRKGLKLGEKDMEAALMTLHRFGNQSSSSLWYELAYLEAKGRVQMGDKVWQIGMGTGPKGVSVVWECIRPIIGESIKNPWADCIHRYPVLM